MLSRHPVVCTVTNQHRTAVTGVSVTETKGVFCQVGIQVSRTVWAVTRAVAPAVSRQPVTAMPVHVGLVADKWHYDSLFCPFFCFPCQYHSTSAAVHLRVQVAVTRRMKGRSLGTVKVPSGLKFGKENHFTLHYVMFSGYPSSLIISMCEPYS
jgi:hypothetical protein